MDVLGDAENPTLRRAQLKINAGVTPRFSRNRVLKECLFSQDFRNGYLGRC